MIKGKKIYSKWLILCLFFLVYISVHASGLTYYNYAEALQKALYFYDAERCSTPGENRLEWRGVCHQEDAKIPFAKTTLDSAYISSNKSVFDPDGDGCFDLSGGYHDAGDHVKFGLPQCYSASTLGWGYYEFTDAFIQTGTNSHMLDVLKGFTDYFLRSCFRDASGKVLACCYMVGEGGTDHTYWGPPELQLESKVPRPADFASPSTPASDQCAGIAAALAIMSLNYKSIDATYAAKCLDTAKALYDFARQYRGLGNGDGFYGSGYDDDELAWAAVWLYVCTNDITYIRHIDSVDANGLYSGYMKRIISSTSNTWQNIWVHCWDVVWAGVFTKLAALFPDNTQFDYFSRWNLEYWTGGKVKHVDASDNNYLAPTAAGYGMINSWGSARYNCGAQLCELVYQKYHTSKTDLTDWAVGQMQYLMGNSPAGYSMIVGYGDKYASHPHHRAAHGSKTNSMLEPPDHRHTLWGALVGGPDGDDVHVDKTTDYVYNEVAIDYNAAFVGALAGYYLLYGKGQAMLANFPHREAAVDEFYAEAKIEQENTERTQVTIKIHNETVHPPRFHTGVSCRYYFSIAEILPFGQSIADVTLTVYYDEISSGGTGKTTMTGPVAVDAVNGLYYLQLAWTNIQWYGDLDLQFALIVKQDSSWTSHWDPSNDYSHAGLNSSDFMLTKNVPVYLDGVLAYGNPPSATTESPAPTAEPSPTPAGTPVPGTPAPTGGLLGDVNASGSIDIVDALLVAQYYVGLSSANFNASNADVTKDGNVDIVDALRIAQYYVGLITGF